MFGEDVLTDVRFTSDLIINLYHYLKIKRTLGEKLVISSLLEIGLLSMKDTQDFSCLIRSEADFGPLNSAEFPS